MFFSVFSFSVAGGVVFIFVVCNVGGVIEVRVGVVWIGDIVVLVKFGLVGVDGIADVSVGGGVVMVVRGVVYCGGVVLVGKGDGYFFRGFLDFEVCFSIEFKVFFVI